MVAAMTIGGLPFPVHRVHAECVKLSSVDLYAVLGVSPDANDAAIRSAYRHLARRHHPDAGGDEHVMMVLNKAWAILRDADRRAAYDHQRTWPRPIATAPARPDTAAKATAAASAAADPATTGFVARESTAPPPIGRASGTVLDFGRYAGWSFGQLAIHDPDYLLWLERTPIGRPMRAEIQATLLRLRPEPEPAIRPPARRRGAFAGLRG
jgi:curved DNA-binding protein CbpA